MTRLNYERNKAFKRAKNHPDLAETNLISGAADQLATPEPTETYRAKKLPAHAFKPGQSGNPAGRPKGSRNLLGQKFLDDLYADYQQHGAKAIAEVRESNPAAYLKVIANLLPAQVQADVNVGVQVVMLPSSRSHSELEQLHQQRLLDVTPQRG